MLSATDPQHPSPLDLAFSRFLRGRDPDDFAVGHLPGSINVPGAARFAELAGKVLGFDTQIILVTAPGDEGQIRNRLGRIGLDSVAGFVECLPERESLGKGDRLDPAQLADRLAGARAPLLLDVREPGETTVEVIEGAITIPLGELGQRLDELDPSAPTVVYCASGMRSSVAASLLVAAGFTAVSDLRGGITSWSRAKATSSR